MARMEKIFLTALKEQKKMVFSAYSVHGVYQKIYSIDTRKITAEQYLVCVEEQFIGMCYLSTGRSMH